MEDLKMKPQDPLRSSKPYVGVAVLVLSLLLGVTVAAIVYQNVISGQVQTCQPPAAQPSAASVDVQATVTVNTDDNKQIKEQISYDQVNQVAYYRGNDGSFNVDDFGKGLHISRDPNDGVCYVIAVGSSNSSQTHDFEKMIRDSDGTEVVAHDTNRDGKRDYAKVLPGEIRDISFIPQGAHKECVNGYKWLAFVSEEDREKRDAPCDHYGYCHVHSGSFCEVVGSYYCWHCIYIDTHPDCALEYH